MDSSYTDAVLIGLSVLFLLLLFLFKKHNQLLLPPGPPKLPFIGNFHQLGELTHVSLWKLSKKYGPVMQLRLGSVPTVVISSAAAARVVLKTHDLHSCSRRSFVGTRRLTYDHLDVAFSAYSDYWKETRRLYVENLLSAKRVTSFGSVREEAVFSMIDSISPSSEVNLSRMTLTLTLTVICKISFGESYGRSEVENARFEELIHETICMLESFCAADFLPRAGWIVDRLTGFHKRLERSFHGLDAFYQRVIDEHKDPKRSKDEDIVDTLLRIARGQTKFPFQLTEEHIKSILMNVLIGGVDTSAIAITWAMTELSRKSSAMKKVQDEIRTRVGKKGRVFLSDLEHLKYFKMVIKETMRLHPPAVLLIPRETISHFKIDNYDVLPKTLVIINAWAIGRDENSWENPEEFHPERFEDNSIDYKGQHYELLPFGAGRRACPGMSLGMATVELTLANLLYSYDWKLPSGMKEDDINMEEAPGIAVRKKVPLKLVPVTYKFA